MPEPMPTTNSQQRALPVRRVDAAAWSSRRAPTAVTSMPSAPACASRGGRPRRRPAARRRACPSASGASLIPAGDRVVALRALEVEDEEEHQREAREPVDERGAGGRREQAVAEDREVEHRRACAALDRPRRAAAGCARRRGRRSRRGSVQPDEPPLEIAEHQAGQADDERRSSRAGRGRARRRAGPARAGRAPPTARPSRPSGTLNQKTHCQEIETSAPPSTGPSTSPIAATIMFVPIARPSCSRGNASVTSAAALANRNARADALQDPPQDQLRAVRRRSRRRARRARRRGTRRRRPACGRRGPTAGRP